MILDFINKLNHVEEEKDIHEKALEDSEKRLKDFKNAIKDQEKLTKKPFTGTSDKETKIPKSKEAKAMGLQEGVLDERLPRDLANAYKRRTNKSRNTGSHHGSRGYYGYGKDWGHDRYSFYGVEIIPDFEQATYEEISVDELKKIPRKDLKDKIRIIDKDSGDLIVLNTRNVDTTMSSGYNGRSYNDIIAAIEENPSRFKIYLTNETEVPKAAEKRREIRKERSNNDNYYQSKYGSLYKDGDYVWHHNSDIEDERQHKKKKTFPNQKELAIPDELSILSNPSNSYEENLQRYLDKREDLLNKISDTEDEEELKDLRSKLSDVNSSIEYYRKEILNAKNSTFRSISNDIDNEARIRYADVFTVYYDKFKKAKQLIRELELLKNDVDKAEKQLNAYKNSSLVAEPSGWANSVRVGYEENPEIYAYWGFKTSDGDIIYNSAISAKEKYDAVLNYYEKQKAVIDKIVNSVKEYIAKLGDEGQTTTLEALENMVNELKSKLEEKKAEYKAMFGADRND